MRSVLLVVIGAVALAAAQAPEDYGAVEDSDCWTCHSAASGYKRPMTPGYGIDPGHVVLDQDLRFSPALVNTWFAELHEVTFELDLTDAPSLSFAGGAEPFQETLAGTLPNHLSTDWATATVMVEIPNATTEVRVELRPTGTTPADLRLRILQGDVLVEQDTEGTGPEVVRLDAARLAGRTGDWTIEAGIAGPSLEVPFQVTVDAWSNASSERVLARYAKGPIMPQGHMPFPFDLVVGEAQAGESVTITARFRMFYEHGDNTIDEWLLTHSETFPLEADGTDVVIGTQVVVAPAPIEDVLGADRVAEVIGYAAAFLLVASIASGGIFGKASRRSLNAVFGSARRRVAFHNFLSYGILMAAIAHLVLFLIETTWHWAWGLIWGGSGILCLLLLGVTGAMQVPIIRRWDYQTWRWLHFGLAIAAIVFTIVHILLDGSHFSTISDSLGWEDPLVPADRQ